MADPTPPAAGTPPTPEGHPHHHLLPAWRRTTEAEQRWPAAIGILIMIGLQLALPSSLTPAGTPVLPLIELVLLGVIMAVNPRRITTSRPWVRWLALVLTGVASLFNAGSMALLIKALVTGTEHDSASRLLGTGANIWVTNIIVFSLWYWEFDRGGPGARALGEDPEPDFLFPQMAMPDLGMHHHWEPQFVDYAYVAFTNATAFSPTDTMPLSRWAKLAMTVQSAVSLVTAALVVARAVNILQ